VITTFLPLAPRKAATATCGQQRRTRRCASYFFFLFFYSSYMCHWLGCTVLSRFVAYSATSCSVVSLVSGTDLVAAAKRLASKRIGMTLITLENSLPAMTTKVESNTYYDDSFLSSLPYSSSLLLFASRTSWRFEAPACCTFDPSLVFERCFRRYVTRTIPPLALLQSCINTSRL
jgi:hypothetical protein